MKFLGVILAFGLALGMSACSGDGNGTSSGGSTCNVVRTSTTVKIEHEVPGIGGYYSMVTDYGNHVIIESEYRYTDASVAESECTRLKNYASSWRDGSVTTKCSGKTISVTEYDEGTLDDHQRDFEEMCEDDHTGDFDDDDDEFDY